MGVPSPSLLLPELERAQWATIREVFREELAEKSLVCAPRRVVERYVVSAGKKLAERAARMGWQPTSRRSEPAAPRAKRPAGGMTEHDGGVGDERGVTFCADVDRWAEPQLGHDVPRTGQRRRECGLLGRASERVERE